MNQKLFLKIVLISLLLFTTYVLSFYIHHNVNKQISDFVNHYSIIFKLHTFYLLVPIVLLVLSLFQRKVSFKQIAIGILLLFLWVFFFNYFELEKWLFKNIFLKISWFQTNNNPQFVKIFLWILLLTFFLLKIIYLKIKKKKLFFEEIFLPLIASSIMITTMVFHYIIPFTMYQYDLYFFNQSYEKIIAHQDYYNVFCKYHSVCYTIDKNNVIKDISRKQKNEFQNKDLIKYINAMNQYFISNPNLKNNFVYDFGNFKNGHFDYIIIAFHFNWGKNENNLMIDNHVMYSFSRMMELIFTFLTIIAHSIWTIGGLFLYIKHQKRN
jgi:hypothetical protein